MYKYCKIFHIVYKIDSIVYTQIDKNTNYELWKLYIYLTK